MKSSELAINGGAPVRSVLLPYGRQSVSEEDIAEVVEVLRSDWLTTGPNVPEFEAAFASFTGSRDSVAVANGTAALHCAMSAVGVGSGDEVIVPAMTFAASANCVLYMGGRPVFADVESDTLLIDPASVESLIGPRTKAIIAVDYAGQPCNYDALRGLAEKHSLTLVSDACHAIGGSWKGRSVGKLADLSTFSLHPVKHMTTGEGGVVTTDDPEIADAIRRFRNHGITTDHRQRAESGSWFYEMTDLGYNYRLTDLQCALGLAQLRHLPNWVDRRREIAALYDQVIEKMEFVEPLATREGARHAYHLFVVKLHPEKLKVDRKEVFAALRAEGIGVNVHYVPVHLHPYYRRVLDTSPGLCPVAEEAYEQILTLPMFPAMSGGDVDDVCHALKKIERAYGQ